MSRLLALYWVMCLTVAASVQEGVVDPQKLSGEIIGAEYSYNGGSVSTTVNTKANAFDGDVSTYFMAYDQSMAHVGLDLGTRHVITRIGFVPRLGTSGAGSTLLGVFEGANSPDFMDAVPLYLISEQPIASSWNFTDVNVSRGFRYVRYVGPAKSRCQIAELQFYGYESDGDDSQFYQVTAIPTLSIHVKDNGIPTTKGQDFQSQMTLVYEGGTLIQEYPLLTRVRGNFSATHENKPYRIKFNDGKSHHMLKGSVNDESPAKAKKWTLINNYGDKTLIRNNIAFEVSRRVGMPYTPYCRNVDLLLNGEYRGTYQLTDWLGTDPKRINITEMAEGNTEGEELTGGYIIEMNGYAGNDPVNFTSSHGNPVTVHSPEDDIIQEVQFNYIRDHFNKMEDAVFSSNYTDPEKGYRSLLDLDTFLKYFLSNEFSTNTDMFWQVYMYKHRGDDHIYTGPVWDHDLGLENDRNYYPANEQSDWTYKVRGAGQWRNLMTRVLTDPAAEARLQDIWASLRDKEIFTSENIQAYVDSLRQLVGPSARLNHIRWPYLLQQVHCNPKVWGTWDAEVDNVVNYVGGRVTWMDNKLRYNKLETVGGFYQIYSASDLMTFAKFVANGEISAKAKIMNDLDMVDYAGRFQPIGTLLRPFRGVLDGNNNVIRNLHVVGTRSVGLFGYAAGGSEIRNLTLDESCRFEGETYVGSFVGNIVSGNANIQACGNEATVVGKSHVGGIVGRNNSGNLTLTDCYNTGVITGDTLAAKLVGFSSGNINISNAYNAGSVIGCEAGAEFANSAKDITFTNCYDTDGHQVAAVDAQQVARGALCYMLNAGANYQLWRQNIDNGRIPDTHPVLQTKHDIVFNIQNTYSNLNPDVEGYRYYMLDISKTQADGTIQFAEVALLDGALKEVEDITIYAGTESNISNEDWPNAADGKVDTKYCSHFNGRAYFMLDAGVGTNIYGYRLYTANDTDRNSGRNPSSWKLYGSNQYTTNPNDDCWVMLDEKENDYTMQATSFTPYDFILDRAIQHLEISPAMSYLNVGGTLQLKLEVEPVYMKDSEFVWSSDNEEVATVDAKGVVTAHSLGEAVIKVTAPLGGGISTEAKVIVTDKPLGYQYYVLEISKIASGGTIQISEFDFLLAGQEYPTLSIYSGPSKFFTGESWRNLCDNTTSTKYCGSFSSAVTLYFDAGELIRPDAYRMYTANDTEGSPGRNPKSWKLWAAHEKMTSSNRDVWILIDERKDDTTMGATNFTPYDFKIDWNEVVDGIEEIPLAPDYSSDIYDLQGRKVSKPHKGVFISSGKKVLLR